MEREARGKHLFADIWEVPEDLGLSGVFVLGLMSEAAQEMGATIVHKHVKMLSDPPGFTSVVLLDESHITCHTYANQRKMAIDIFVCGEGKDPLVGWEYLKEKLGVTRENYYWEIHPRFLVRF